MTKHTGWFGWPEAAVLELAQLWNAGVSIAQIGLKLGISKNAVIGKVHRLQLPSRGSPIRRASGQCHAHPASPSKPVPSPCTQPPQEALKALPRAPAPDAPLPAPASLTPRKRASGEERTFCWPLGEPGAKSFRFCEAAVGGRASYCAEHAARAYVRPVAAREVSAGTKDGPARPP